MLIERESIEGRNHKHLNSRWIANSAEMLRELDEQANELEE